MATVTIEVPDDAFKALHRSPQELGREIRLAAAMLWYSQGRISHEKAAQIAGVSRIDLIDALAAARLPAFSLLVSLGSDLVLVSLGSDLVLGFFGTGPDRARNQIPSLTPGINPV